MRVSRWMVSPSAPWMSAQNAARCPRAGWMSTYQRHPVGAIPGALLGMSWTLNAPSVMSVLPPPG
ncbi:hypothetical protein DF268_08530 [Streptomyces sp. V2]|nr:hypothetical protein DF268_08530 [Streptomyces sp. V2]